MSVTHLPCSFPYSIAMYSGSWMLLGVIIISIWNLQIANYCEFLSVESSDYNAEHWTTDILANIIIAESLLTTTKLFCLHHPLIVFQVLRRLKEKHSKDKSIIYYDQYITFFCKRGLITIWHTKLFLHEIGESGFFKKQWTI